MAATVRIRSEPRADELLGSFVIIVVARETCAAAGKLLVGGPVYAEPNADIAQQLVAEDNKSEKLSHRRHGSRHSRYAGTAALRRA